MRYFRIKVSLNLVGCEIDTYIKLKDNQVKDDGWPYWDSIVDIVFEHVEVIAEEVDKETYEKKS